MNFKKNEKKHKKYEKMLHAFFCWQQHVLFFQLSLAKTFLTLHKKAASWGQLSLCSFGGGWRGYGEGWAKGYVPQEALIFQTIGHSLAEVSTFDTFKVLMNMEMRVKLQIHAFSRLCTTPPPSTTPFVEKIAMFPTGTRRPLPGRHWLLLAWPHPRKGK